MSSLKYDEMDMNASGAASQEQINQNTSTGSKGLEGGNIENELLEQDTGFDYNGFMAIGGDTNSVNEHVQNMKKIMENKYGITCISDGWKYPIITFSKKVGNVVFYYPTILSDDDKRAMTLSSFVQGLSQKDADIYTLDIMYKQEEDEEVKIKLKEMYPTIKEFIPVATSVVRYSEESYNDINILVSRLLEVAPIVHAGKDQSLVNTPKNFKIFYNDIPSGTKLSRTGMAIRADFKLTLASNNQNNRSSNNSTNKDIAYAFGYIDLVPEEDVQQQQYGAPIVTKKLRPIVVITDFYGLSASSSYSLLGIITAANMLSRDMYMGYILKHANRFADLIGVTLQENVDMSKLTPGEKSEVLEQLIMNPIMALDVPNNGYLEEISYFLNSDADRRIKSAASKLTGVSYKSRLIDYVIPMPYVEYFDKTMKDVREIDCAKVASITKDISLVLGYAKITNDASQDGSQTVANLATLLNEIAIDGEIIGTYGRIFLSEEGIAELISLANLKVTYTPIYEAPKTTQGFMRRTGYAGRGFYQNGFSGNGGFNRGYKTF